MSARPQGRGRQIRRDRSQRIRGRDHSADSVSSTTSTQSERERDREREQRNGRNSRRRPEKKDERGRRRNEEGRRDIPDREGSKATDKDKGKPRSESEKQPPRGRGEPIRDPPRELNRDSFGSKGSTNERNNMFGDDSRLSHLVKRIGKESERDRRLTAAQQFEEFLNIPDNSQVVDKHAENLFIVLEDVLFERGQPELKEKIATCVGIIGGILGNEAGRFFQWIFAKLESSASDEVKILLLTALYKAIQVDTKNKYFRDFMTNVMSSLQNILENVDTSDLLRAALNVMMPIAIDYPHAFAGHFRDTVDILVGWHIDTSQQTSLTSYTSECLVKLHDYWASDIAFSLTLLSQFLEDMEAYAEELGMLSNQVVSSEEIPSPYVSLPRLTALVRVFTTVVNGIGPSFSPNRSPSITPPYLTELIQRIIQCINMSGYSYYYEKLFVSANECLESMCSWLQPYFSCCCEITASFVIQQLQSSSCVTYPHIMSALQLIQKVIIHVNTAIPATFIQQLLEPDSPIMKLRSCSDQAVLSSVMKIYQGFLGIHDVPLLETAYRIAVKELIGSFNLLRKTLPSLEMSDNNLEPLSSSSNKETGSLDPDKDKQSDTLNTEEDTPAPIPVQVQSSHELESIIIFDLCALSEIATTKSAILRLWKLSPSTYQLLTQHLDACEWKIAVCHPSVQYTILHALYTYCQRYNHFLPSSPSEGLHSSPDGDMVSMLSLLSKVLGNSSTSEDSRKLCLVWLVEILDRAVTSGVLGVVIRHVNLDSMAESILPSSFDHNLSISLEVSFCLNILVDLKVLSRNCLRKFFEDCAVRLMDLNKEVCMSYQQLIGALPIDILTSSLSQSLFESRRSQCRGSEHVGKPLTTSCSDVWLARKGHIIKPPSGSFHSHDFQIVMGFILSGVYPSKEANADWLLRLFHSCNRVQKYAESEMLQFNRCESLLWFWATWEAAQFCILSRLRTPLGRAQETFQAIEGALQMFELDARGEQEEKNKVKHEEPGSKEEEGNETVACPKSYTNHLQSVLLLQFVENLEKLMYNGYEGCVVGLPSPPKSVRIFFRTNRSTCMEWLTRVRKGVMTIGTLCGCPAVTVWHGFQTLQEMKAAGNTKGEDFDKAVSLTAQALCELKSAHAISGLMAWCEQVSGQKYSWMNGTVTKAKGWYECSAKEYKVAVEGVSKGTEKGQQEERKTSEASTPSIVTTFLVDEVADCYMKLSSWSEVSEWQKYVSNLRKHCTDSDIQHSLMANVDTNYVKALSKFEECDFISVRNHLRLVPGAALNSLTENLNKSAWSAKLNHPDTTFSPAWAPDKIVQTAELSLIQAQTLFFTSGNLKAKTKENNSKDEKIIQTIKECVRHATSLSEGVLQIGTLGWPLEVSASHITQLQFATAMENIIESTRHQEDYSPSFLRGIGNFNVDHTQHDCGVLMRALRFCGNLHYLANTMGKHQNQLRTELISLQMGAAQLARKHHNFNLAYKLLVKQISLLGNAAKVSQDVNCGKKQSLEPLMDSLNDPSFATAKPIDVMEIQRECSKLAFAIGHPSEAVNFLAESISQYANLGDIDSNVGALNSKSLLTLAKWLLNDRKLLTAVTKVNGNGLSVAAKINSLCELETSYVSLSHSTLISAQEESEYGLNSSSVTSVANGITDAESVCGQLLHLATMQAPDLGKVWFNLAGWCYRWGRKTVEQASSMGNVGLLPQEKETVLQSLPQNARPAEVESVMLVLGQVHVTAYFNQEEDIGEEDQLYDDGLENTKKQLLTVCPGLHDAQPQLLENLLSVWRGVRDRLFKHYHFAAKAYFMYLKMGSEDLEVSSGAVKNTDQTKRGTKNSDDDSNVTATLRLLRLLVKHAGELRSELEDGLVKTPTRPWKDITPQLFSRLNHPESYVRQSVSELLCRVGQDAPHLIVYPAVVGCSTSLPKYLLNKGKEGEGLLPLLVPTAPDVPAENSQNQGNQTSETQGIKTENDALTTCYQTIVESIRTHNPQLVSELQGFIMELRRITLLWEELWHGSLMQTHHDVTRRQQQLEDEIKRVSGNQNLTNQQKATLIREKHIAIMKPVVFAIEQLNKITCQEPGTPHEQWFQMSYSSAIQSALESLQNPPDPADHRSSWEPFKQLLQAFQARSQKRSAYTLHMDEISPTLSSMKGSAVYMPGQTHFSGKIVTIDSVVRDVNILPTKTKPKKLVFVGSDGQRYAYLFKGLEDLHLDERIMQFLSICNNMFTRVDSHNSPLFCARHYSVTPLGPRSGLIQWVDGAVPVFALFKRWQQREGASAALIKTAQGANPQPPPPMKPSELYYSKMTPALKDKGITDLNSRREWPLSVMKHVLEELMKETPNDLLAKELWCSSTSAAEWWQMTQSYARSTAVMSMIGYIIGLGDRHLDNMLVDFTTGEVVHIDYNVCFEKGKGLRVPEKVPFRMTPNLETALGVTGVEGVFRLSCEEVLKILKQGRETLLTLLEAFVYDPLVDWTTANDTAFASAFYGGGAPGVTDNKMNKKEMERDVTQSLFSSRVAEMKVTWTNNKDELQSGMTKLDEQLDTYLASLKQSKSLDVATEELKDQQETLQAAISNPQHPLHMVQAKFDEKRKLQADHDAVLQSINEKLAECQQWQVQHKAAMGTVHGPKLAALVGEVLQPLDLGLPSFAPAINFLQGAGQGHIVSQCEQLETELSGLLHQGRTMFRSCLDLLHTYATVTSLFPSDYVQQNRSFEWQSWLQSLVEDSSTKKCQEVIEESEKLHNKPVADSPLTLAEVTGFMAMEVKLQSSLTEQNAKFIKFSERRKQESVETTFLSKAVGEAYAALKKYITGKQPASYRCLTGVLITALCSLNKRCLAMENTAKVAKDRLSDLTSREGDWFLDELCSMSGNVNQLLLLLKDHQMEVKDNQQAILGQAQYSMKAVLTVQRVFMALQELMTNFRTIIVPEAFKSIYIEDPSVFTVIQQVQTVAHTQKISLRELAENVEARLLEGHISSETAQKHSPEEVDAVIQELRTQFEKLLLTSKISGSDSGEDSSSTMTSGQMLLAGFNGLFTKVASELSDMFTAFERVHFDKRELKFDVVRDAQNLQVTNSAKNAELLSKLFFLKRLEVIISFFKSCRLVTLTLKGVSHSGSMPGAANCTTEPSTDLFTNSDSGHGENKVWNPDKCYSEDDLAVHVKHFIADCVQQCIMGLPSQALAAVIIKFAIILGSKGDKEVLNEEGVVILEDYCKKVVDGNVTSGMIKSKQLSQITSLTSSYDVAWRKHDFAKRLDNNMNIYKGVVQRAQLQLARFQWLYEDNLLQCPMRGSSMITPARATIMADLKKRVQGLIHMDSVVKGVEEKLAAQESSIEQRLKWAAGANPALNPVLQNFEQTLAARKMLMTVESKHSSDICSLSNAILHCEALRTHTADALGVDKVMTTLIQRCQQSSAEIESCSEKLHDVTEVAKKVKVSYPPEAPITLDWMKNKLDTVGQEMASFKARKTQVGQAIMANRDSIKLQASSVKTIMVAHQQLIGDVKSMLTTMAKDEEAAESRQAKLFISTHNRQSEECAQLIKSILAVCGGKISDGKDHIEDNIADIKSMVKSIKSLVQWVHDHLLSLASPLVPDESGASGGKTPIAAPPPTFASGSMPPLPTREISHPEANVYVELSNLNSVPNPPALRQGSGSITPSSKESGSSDVGSPHPVILQRDMTASPSGASSPTASSRVMAVASPRRISSANLARDPRTGKALQERNTYAISVWRRVKAKLDGRDQDNKKMSIADQVDFVIRESRSVDNLCQMYEGWTAWV